MKRILLLALLAVGCGSTSGSSSGDDASVDQGGNDSSVDPPISECPSGTWCLETLPDGVTGLLAAVHAPDANHVFAVGDGGMILLRTNGAWKQMTSNTTANLRGVWAASATEAWAAGENGTIVHLRDGTWTAQSGVVANISNNGVWGSSASDVHVVGTARIQRWNGTAWSSISSAGTPTDITGTGANNVYVTGEGSKVRRYTSSWAYDNAAPTTNFSIEAISATDVWACNASCVHWDGTNWNTVDTGLVAFAAMYASSGTRVFGVSQNDIGLWNGTSWVFTTPTGLTANLYGVTGVGPHVWAVGTGAVAYRRD